MAATLPIEVLLGGRVLGTIDRLKMTLDSIRQKVLALRHPFSLINEHLRRFTGISELAWNRLGRLGRAVAVVDKAVTAWAGATKYVFRVIMSLLGVMFAWQSLMRRIQEYSFAVADATALMEERYEALSEIVGEHMAPVIEWLTTLLDPLIEFMEEHPTLAKLVGLFIVFTDVLWKLGMPMMSFIIFSGLMAEKFSWFLKHLPGVSARLKRAKEFTGLLSAEQEKAVKSALKLLAARASDIKSLDDWALLAQARVILERELKKKQEAATKAEKKRTRQMEKSRRVTVKLRRATSGFLFPLGGLIGAIASLGMGFLFYGRMGELLGEVFTGLGDILGNLMAPILEPLADYFEDVADEMEEFSGAPVTSIKEAADALRLRFSSALEKLRPIFEAVIGVWWDFIHGIIFGTNKARELAKQAEREWAEWSQKVSSAFKKVSEALGLVETDVKETTKTIDSETSYWPGYFERATEIPDISDDMKKKISTPIRDALSEARSFLGTFETFKNLGLLIPNLSGIVWDRITSPFAVAWQTLKGIYNFFTDKIAGLGTFLPTITPKIELPDWLENALSGVLKAVTISINVVKGTIDTLINWVYTGIRDIVLNITSVLFQVATWLREGLRDLTLNIIKITFDVAEWLKEGIRTLSLTVTSIDFGALIPDWLKTGLFSLKILPTFELPGIPAPPQPPEIPRDYFETLFQELGKAFQPPPGPSPVEIAMGTIETLGERAIAEFTGFAAALGKDIETLLIENVGITLESGISEIVKKVQTFWEFLQPPELQRGGFITRTGLARVHRGETVLPRRGGASIIINNTFNIERPVFRSEDDIRRLAEEISRYQRETYRRWAV